MNYELVKIGVSAVLAIGFAVVVFRLLRRRDASPPQPLPKAPCGNDAEHAYWKSEGWPCPICCAIKDRAAKRRAQEEQAELIASKVVAKLNRRSRHAR